jgi:magnesium-transporting ATPase (P-type)
MFILSLIMHRIDPDEVVVVVVFFLFIIFFLFIYLKIVTTRASPLGIPRDIYRGETLIRVKISITQMLWSCCCCGAWFPFSYSSSKWRMLLRKFETLTVCT